MIPRLLYSQFWVLLCGLSIVISIFLQGPSPLKSIHYIYAVHFLAAVYLIYTLDRLPGNFSRQDLYNQPGLREYYLKRRQWILFRLWGALAVLVATAFFLPVWVLLTLVILAFVTALQLLPILPKWQAGSWTFIRLQDFVFLKPVVLALVWLGSAVIIPQILADIKINVILQTMWFVLFYYNCLFFAKLDAPGDRRVGKLTKSQAKSIRRVPLSPLFVLVLGYILYQMLQNDWNVTLTTMLLFFGVGLIAAERVLEPLSKVNSRFLLDGIFVLATPIQLFVNFLQ